MIGAPSGKRRLLELRRLHSYLTVDLVEWPGGKLAASIGFTSISDRNPAGASRFITIVPDEIPAVIRALEEASSRLEDEREEEPTS